MSFAKELLVARVRLMLRQQLAVGNNGEAATLLATFRRLAIEDGETASTDLEHEYQRWVVRLSLVA